MTPDNPSNNCDAGKCCDLMFVRFLVVGKKKLGHKFLNNLCPPKNC